MEVESHPYHPQWDLQEYCRTEGTAQVLLAWGIQRGTAVLTSSVRPARIRENFDVTALPESAMQDITERLEARYRFNSVVDAGERGFIEVPKGS